MAVPYDLQASGLQVYQSEFGEREGEQWDGAVALREHRKHTVIRCLRLRDENQGAGGWKFGLEEDVDRVHQ